jgi:hypothetical protein
MKRQVIMPQYLPNSPMTIINMGLGDAIRHQGVTESRWDIKDSLSELVGSDKPQTVWFTKNKVPTSGYSEK